MYVVMTIMLYYVYNVMYYQCVYSCTLLQQLGEVARESMGKSAPPPMEDLLACVKNIRQVALLLQQPGRRFRGPAGPHAAAVCIQAHWR